MRRACPTGGQHAAERRAHRVQPLTAVRLGQLPPHEVAYPTPSSRRMHAAPATRTCPVSAAAYLPHRRCLSAAHLRASACAGVRLRCHAFAIFRDSQDRLGHFAPLPAICGRRAAECPCVSSLSLWDKPLTTHGRRRGRRYARTPSAEYLHHPGPAEMRDTFTTASGAASWSCPGSAPALAAHRRRGDPPEPASEQMARSAPRPELLLLGLSGGRGLGGDKGCDDERFPQALYYSRAIASLGAPSGPNLETGTAFGSASAG
jgi:hypothetical protein